MTILIMFIQDEHLGYTIQKSVNHSLVLGNGTYRMEHLNGTIMLIDWSAQHPGYT